MGYVVIQIISDQSPLCLFLQAERLWASPESSEEDFPSKSRRDKPLCCNNLERIPFSSQPLCRAQMSKLPCLLPPARIWGTHRETDNLIWGAHNQRKTESISLSEIKISFVFLLRKLPWRWKSHLCHLSWAWDPFKAPVTWQGSCLISCTHHTHSQTRIPYQFDPRSPRTVSQTSWSLK